MNIKCFLILTAIALCGCTRISQEGAKSDNAAKIRFEYSWQPEHGRPEHSYLEVNDSTLCFYPKFDEVKIFQKCRLSQVQIDSILLLASGVLNSGQSEAGNFEEWQTRVDYTLTGIMPDQSVGYATPQQLNRYLIDLLGEPSDFLKSTFMLPVRASEMCNDRGWRVIELEIHRASISDIKERLIIDRKCVSYENQDFPEQRASYEISDSILGQLDDMVSRVDPAVEYQYWFEEQTTFDGEEEGISILIDGKRIATVSSWSEMPTQPLKHLFAVLYALSPYELALHSNPYGGLYDVPD